MPQIGSPIVRPFFLWSLIPRVLYLVPKYLAPIPSMIPISLGKHLPLQSRAHLRVAEDAPPSAEVPLWQQWKDGDGETGLAAVETWGTSFSDLTTLLAPIPW